MTQLDTAALDHPQLDLAAALLQSGSAIRLRALGGSMLPALWPGDLLTIDPISCSAIRSGEIVLGVRDRRFFIHRLIQVGSPSGNPDWITRGDALPYPDPGVPAKAILGRVSSITRGRSTLLPRQQPTAFGRIFAWVLCRSERLCKLALRIHFLRQEFWKKNDVLVEERQSSLSQTAQ